MKCLKCNYEFSDKTKFCPECGTPSGKSNIKIECKNCGYELSDDLKFCPECGKPTQYIHEKKENRGQRNRTRDNDNDDDDEGGMLGNIGDFIGKIFG